MLRLYPSNKTESLASVMAAIMKAQPLQDPFAEETVLIQSQGMGTWLRQVLSHDLGVAALIQAQMPASFVWQLATRLLEGGGVSPLFEKNYLRWEIMRVLPGLIERESFSPLKNYLNALAGARVSTSDQDLFQLSDRLADSFDAYQNYRSDWIESWERGEMQLGAESAHITQLETWQAELWQALYCDTASDRVSSSLDAQEPVRLHRPRQLRALRELLTSGKFDRSLLPQRLFVFGLSALPPQWLEIFLLLGRYIDIHFLVQNPCRYYWGDVQSERQQLRYQQSLLAQGVSTDSIIDADHMLENNALLASWGKLGRDYLSTLYQYDETQGLQEFESSLYDDWVENSGRGSALALLQQDVLDLASQKHAIKPDDLSIRFASCHSRLREVEALKDFILDALDRDSELELKDIIVMMPDVQDYAALVDAVFSEGIVNERGQEQRLSFAVSDQSTRSDHSLVEFIAQLLDIRQSPVSATEVLDWLNIEPVRERFGLSELDLECIHGWIEHLNVRWGMSARHRKQVTGVASENERNTWLRAARRLLAGHLYGASSVISLRSGCASMSSDDCASDGAGLDREQLLPAALQGREAQDVLGKLLLFLTVVENTIDTLAGKKQGSEWLASLRTLFLDWFDSDCLAESFSVQLEQILDLIEEQLRVTEFVAPVEFSVIAGIFRAELEQGRVSQRFLAGRINFCTLMPMRSIPFKLVCLLGMNEGEYPRPSVQSGFDLLGLVKPRRGDRSRRDDDRYLFLEALLSVRSRLYISYVGRSVQDNSERFPSTLVSELQDYCDQYFELDSQINGLTPDGSSTTQAWTINHRLQAFHSAYYLDNAQDVGFEQLSRPLPKSYNAAWENLFNRDEPNRQLSASTNEAVDSPLQSSEVRRLDLSEIIAALVNPLRHYYRRMGVDAPWLEEGFEDSEPFNLNGFEEFSLKQSLLSTSQSETLQAQIVERWELADYLPQAPFDRHLIAQAAESVASIRAELPEPDAMSETLTTLNLGSWRVDARFIHLGSSLQAVTLSRNPAQALFALWVQHVFWQLHCARDPNLTRASDSVLYMQGKHWVLPALTEEDADLYANGLLEEFGRSDSQTICFLPKTAFSQLFESSAKASLAFWGSDSAQFNLAGEQQDFFWQRYCLLSGQSVSFEDDLPSMEGSVLFQQLRQQVDQIKELSL